MTLPYNNTIHHQDCLEGMRKIKDHSADLVICDPPYNIGKNFGNNHDNLPIGEYAGWAMAWAGECLRILKESGTMFVYGFPEILAHISVKLPLDKQRWLQWHYTNKNMPNLNFWQRSHESILCVWTGKPVFNRDDVREPYTQGFLNGSAGRIRPGGQCRLSQKGDVSTRYNAHAKGAMPRDVLNVPSLAGGAALKERNIYCKTCACLVDPAKRREHAAHQLIVHPTQKPLALTKKLILSCRPETEFTALIPFCGSGSECKCVLNQGGKFISFELNEDYLILARSVTACKKEQDGQPAQSRA